MQSPLIQIEVKQEPKFKSLVAISHFKTILAS